jgi:serine protease AprX
MDPDKKDELRESHIAESASANVSQKDQRDAIKQDMARSFITQPLLARVVQAATKDGRPDARFDVIISLNETFPGGVVAASKWVARRAVDLNVKYYELPPYVFACLTAQQILDLAQEARELTRQYGRTGSVVYRIWEDQDISTTLTKSLITVKADAAHRAFEAFGEGIVWAVLDSGIQGDHPHFSETQPQFRDDQLLLPLMHLDFTPDGRQNYNADGPQGMDPTALMDRFGHGTHVAGIIAGCWKSSRPEGEPVVGSEMHDEVNDKGIPQRAAPLKAISGVAPKAKLISLKVIADIAGPPEAKQIPGQGKVSWVLMAIDQIQRWNQYGKQLLIHGANLSLGYEFNPRWFACGKSPLCVEVDRLVRSGVVVVVSAGNGGYSLHAQSNGQWQAGYNNLSITDPGNADLAITVGSTHREKPHLYGVSYFSSRGPTGDGRLKPDLIAPGERIISCAAGEEKMKYRMLDENGKPLDDVLYCELSGTSMAAPHVSGAVAAFLSVRQEYIGEPGRVKQILIDNAIDMRREPSFQGAGLLDLMKVLQSV